MSLSESHQMFVLLAIREIGEGERERERERERLITIRQELREAVI